MKLNKKLKTRKSWSKVLLYAFIISVSFCFNANAQQTTVTGVISSSEDGLPIPGVAVVLKGTTTGAISDFDGNYSINAKIGDVLNFTYLGMETKTVKVTGNKLDVKMDSDLEDLEEVVVIGYGTQKKKEVAGAVARVTAKDIAKNITSDLADALQGQISGVNVVASGEAGEPSNIIIRGLSSVTGSNSPLFVVDGIPQDGDPQLSPNEIETLDVLKDAASASIYGSRASGGVILITTKKGTPGRMNISFDVSTGIRRINSGLDLLNAREQIAVGLTSGEILKQLNDRFIANDTDLRPQIEVDNALTKTYNLQISGGTKELSYSIVSGLFDQEGSIIKSNYKRYNGRANTRFKKGAWNISAGLGFNIENRERPAQAIVNQANFYIPYKPNIEIGSSEPLFVSGNAGTERQVSTALNTERGDKRDRFNANVRIGIDLAKGLNFKTNLGTIITTTHRTQYIPPFIEFDVDTGELEPIEPERSGYQASTRRNTVFSWDGSLNYTKKIRKHTFRLLALLSLEERSSVGFGSEIQGIRNNGIKNFNSGTVNESILFNNSQDTREKLVGTILRFQYNYKSKYLLSASVRRDGSSKFLKEKWGTFPSLSLGWNVSDEGFWKPIKHVVNNFKLRASYGSTGNNSFSANRAVTATLSGLDYYYRSGGTETLAIGLSQGRFGNESIIWETSLQKNIGFDLGFLKNKVTLSGDYYVTDKEDMLFSISLPPSAGGTTNVLTSDDVVYNVGNMTNKGIELSAKYRDKIGKVSFGTSVTFTKNVNKITKINGQQEIIPTGRNVVNNQQNSAVTAIMLGRDAGAFYLYKTNGVIKTPEQLTAYKELDSDARLGDLMYVNTDGSNSSPGNEITIADKVYGGSSLPDYELGLNFNLDYKNFDLSMFWYASVGGEIVNAAKANVFHKGRHRDLLYQWSPSNPDSNIPVYRGDKNEHRNFAGNTDFFLEDGSFVRLKNITLGYSLPKDVNEKIGISNLRFFLSAQNPVTITKYTGYDPEIGGSGDLEGIGRGVDNGNYPVSSLYSLGLKLDF